MRSAFVAVLSALLVAAVPAEGAGPQPRQSAIPILMYHVVTDPPAGAPYPALYVGKAEFAAQIRALASRGYRAVTLTQVYDHWRHHAQLPRRPIVLTFDDGYRSVYENALPILRARGWSGVLNLEVRFMNKPWGLAQSRIRVLLMSGWELASHTINHQDLTALSTPTLHHEVHDSRFLLQRIFHVPVSFFCYPAGRYDGRVIRAVRATGYRGATTTRDGLARPNELFTLARIRVNRGDGGSGLVAKLAALGG